MPSNSPLALHDFAFLEVFFSKVIKGIILSDLESRYQLISLWLRYDVMSLKICHRVHPFGQIFHSFALRLFSQMPLIQLKRILRQFLDRFAVHSYMVQALNSVLKTVAFQKKKKEIPKKWANLSIDFISRNSSI